MSRYRDCAKGDMDALGCHHCGRTYRLPVMQVYIDPFCSDACRAARIAEGSDA